MDPWHPILSVVCFLAAYGWAYDQHLDHKMTKLLAGKAPHHGKAVYSLVKTYEPRTLLPAEFVFANMRRKRRAKRNTEESPMGDAEAFLKLLELAKAVSGSANAPSKAKYRALDSDEYSPTTSASTRRRSGSRKGLSYRHNAEEDFSEDVLPEYKSSGRDDGYNNHHRQRDAKPSHTKLMDDY